MSFIILKNTKNRIFSSKKGFTLIELVVVISVTAILSLSGIAAFVNYNRTAALEGAALELKNTLRTAKSRAQSQAKPVSCIGNLDGFAVSIKIPGASYELNAKCNGVLMSSPMSVGKLPSNVSFATSTTAKIVFFPVLTGGVVLTGGGVIELVSYGKTITITIDPSGTIN